MAPVLVPDLELGQGICRSQNWPAFPLSGELNDDAHDSLFQSFKTYFTFENECLYVTDPDWGQHRHRVGGKGMFSVHSLLDLLRNDGLF